MSKGLENKGKYPFHYLRRVKDGAIIDVPDKVLESTLSRGSDFEYISGFGLTRKQKVEEGVVVDVPVVEDKFECPLCGFVAETERALKLHKDKQHA